MKGTITRIGFGSVEQPDQFNVCSFMAAMVQQTGASGAMAFDDHDKGVGILWGGDGNLSFFLPVKWVVEALQCILNDNMPSRGDIQVKWSTLDRGKCKARGLDEFWLTKFREAGVDEIVTALVVLPHGPSDGKVKPGDILLQVDGLNVAHLDTLAAYMDQHVGERAKFKCWTGRKICEYECEIQDLHVLNPHRLLRRWGTVFHSIPPWIAFANNIPLRGAMVAKLSIHPFRDMNIVEAIDDQPIKSLDDLKLATADFDVRKPVVVLQKPLGTYAHAVPTMGHCLQAPAQSCGDLEMRMEPLQGGPWTLVSLEAPKSVPCPLATRDKKSLAPDIAGLEPTPIQVQRSGDETLEKLTGVVRGMVKFKARRQIFCDQVTSTSTVGYGFIVDADGFIAVPREDLTMFDEVMLTFDRQLKVCGSVYFLHPNLNQAILNFNIDNVPAELRYTCPLAPKQDTWSVKEGSNVFFMPFHEQYRTLLSLNVENIGEISGAAGIESFQPFEVTTCTFDRSLVMKQRAGLMLDAGGAVVGMMLQADECLPSTALHDLVEALPPGGLDELRFRDFFVKQTLAEDVFQLGLDRRVWATRVAAKESMVLCVTAVPQKCFPRDGKEPIDHPLRRGDLLLEVFDDNDDESHDRSRLVSKSSEVGYQWKKDTLKVRVFRPEKGEVVELVRSVPLLSVQETNTFQAIQFCGTWYQKPVLSSRLNIDHLPSEVYSHGYTNGSSAELYNLSPGGFLVAVNGERISSMTDLEKLAKQISFREYFDVTVVNRYHVERVVSIKIDVLEPVSLWKRLDDHNNGCIERSIINREKWRQLADKLCADKDPQPH